VLVPIFVATCSTECKISLKRDLAVEKRCGYPSYAWGSHLLVLVPLFVASTECKIGLKYDLAVGRRCNDKHAVCATDHLVRFFSLCFCILQAGGIDCLGTSKSKLFTPKHIRKHILAWRILESTREYWRLLEITGDYWGLPEITGE